jgi:catalase-peroxidase
MTFTINARDTGETKFTATRCDLIFGSNQQLRSVSEVYASSDGERRFANDFARVWDKVMMLDRYDIKKQ